MKEREIVSKANELLQAVRVLRKEFSRLELGQLEVFLTICSRPGLRGVDIAEAMEGITEKSVHKSVRVLSEIGGENGREPLRLIDRIPDPDDGRALVLVPTRRAWMLVQGAALAMQSAGKNRGPTINSAVASLEEALKRDNHDGPTTGEEVAGGQSDP